MTASPMAAIRAGWIGSRLGGLPRQYWVLFAGLGCARIGWFIIPFHILYLSHHRRLDPVDATVVLMAFGSGWAMSQPLGGLLADRIGRKTTIAAAAFASAVTILGFGSARTMHGLTVAALAAGVCFELSRPAAHSMTVHMMPSDYPQALGLLYVVANVGRGIGCLVAGLLAYHAFWGTFLICAVANLGYALAVLAGIPDVATDRIARTRAGLTAALTDPAMLAFTAITFVFYLVLLQSAITLPAVVDPVHASPATTGLILGIGSLAVAIAQLLLQGRLTPHGSHRTHSSATALLQGAAGIAIVGIGLAIAGAGRSVTWFAATTPIWIIGEVAFLGIAPGVLASLAPPALRGTYFGVWGSCQGIAAIGAPAASSALIRIGGSDLLWRAGAAAAAIAALACLLLRAATCDRRAATSGADGGGS